MTSPVRAPRATPRSQPAAHPAPTRPDLRVVDAPRRRSRAGLVVAASSVVVFAALLAGAVAHSLLVTGQVHLDDVGVEVRAEREKLQREQLRLARYESPARITAAARRIGMVPADQQNWVSPGADDAAVVTGGSTGGTTPPDLGGDRRTGPAPRTELATGTSGTSGETVERP